MNSPAQPNSPGNSAPSSAANIGQGIEAPSGNLPPVVEPIVYHVFPTKTHTEETRINPALLASLTFPNRFVARCEAYLVDVCKEIEVLGIEDSLRFSPSTAVKSAPTIDSMLGRLFPDHLRASKNDPDAISVHVTTVGGFLTFRVPPTKADFIARLEARFAGKYTGEIVNDSEEWIILPAGSKNTGANSVSTVAS